MSIFILNETNYKIRNKFKYIISQCKVNDAIMSPWTALSKIIHETKEIKIIIK